MNKLTSRLARRLVRRVVSQPRPRDALIRFLYFTEEFVERFDIEPILPHLDEEQRKAMLHHFHDEKAHARALRQYCEDSGLEIARSHEEEAIVRRSDEGYAQYLRHLDARTNKFTASEMYAYYSHVKLQEDLAANLYHWVADELERREEHARLVLLLRAFARSETKHEDSANALMTRYEAELGQGEALFIRLRTRWLSATSGTRFLRDFLRLLAREHDFDAGPLALAL